MVGGAASVAWVLHGKEMIMIGELIHLQNIKMFSDYPDVVSVKQACEMLGGKTSPTLVRRLCKEGKFVFRRLGREFRITKLSIIKYFYSSSQEGEICE